MIQYTGGMNDLVAKAPQPWEPLVEGSSDPNAIMASRQLLLFHQNLPEPRTAAAVLSLPSLCSASVLSQSCTSERESKGSALTLEGLSLWDETYRQRQALT